MIFLAFAILAIFFVGVGVLLGGVVTVTVLQRTNSAWSLLAIPVGGIGCVVMGFKALWLLMS